MPRTGPGLLAGAGAAVLIALGALVAPATAGAAPAQPPGFAPVGAATIRPGVALVTGDAVCTANFVFRAGGGVHLGYAAHCAGLGEAADVDGCATPTRPLGAPVTIVAADGTRHRGTLAYSSWVAMQRAGVRDPALCALNDFALVALDPAVVGLVNPTVPRFGGPTGVAAGPLAGGDRVFSFQPNALQRAAKRGMVLRSIEDGLAHLVVTAPLGVPGDSGSGYLDADGAAFGVLSALVLDEDGEPLADRVGDLRAELAFAAEFGDLGRIELVPGTEPFAPAAAGPPAGGPVTARP